MAHAVNAGARLDRLPVSSFHYRIFWLVGAGMFFDGYDLYIAGGVLASVIQTKFSTIPQNLQFISLTFVGMTLGALITGFVGDKFGRRFTYQINLLIFGLAAAIRTRDVGRAHRVASAVKAGIVWINDHHRLDPASPWGGVDDSGIGREFGSESFNDHFNTKSVMVATHDQPFDWYRDTAAQRRLN